MEETVTVKSIHEFGYLCINAVNGSSSIGIVAQSAKTVVGCNDNGGLNRNNKEEEPKPREASRFMPGYLFAVSLPISAIQRGLYETEIARSRESAYTCT
jgi:hypothetical protein